nr:AAA family ATPase [uncultured Undibacterium sp.]
MKILIEGYKSIAMQRAVNFKGLTILSGANSSGKSSFMQPLLLIKQSLENDFDAGGLLLNGPNVKLTDSSQILSKVPNCFSDSFKISLIDD